MRICKNEITDLIRKHFGANPMKIPESRVQPLTLIEIRDEKTEFLGAFDHLLKDEWAEVPKIKESDVSEVSGVQTKIVPLTFGFDILKNFLKAFGIDPGVISASLKNTKTLSFSFESVKRRYVEPLTLGKSISKNGLLGDTDNIFIQKIIQDNDSKLGLIIDVLVSNNFMVSSFEENEAKAEINIPLINEYLSKVKLDVEVEKRSSHMVKFRRKTYLTFAFSCVELKIDPKTGKFSRGRWLKNIRQGKEDTTENTSDNKELEQIAKLLIDDVEANPLLIEF